MDPTANLRELLELVATIQREADNANGTGAFERAKLLALLSIAQALASISEDLSSIRFSVDRAERTGWGAGS